MKDNVLNYLKKQKDFVSFDKIFDALHLETAEEKKELEDVLNELKYEYLLFVSNNHMYQLYETNKTLFCGELTFTEAGNGFIKLKDHEDLFVGREYIKFALPGDIVVGEIKPPKQGDYVSKKSGYIVEIIQIVKRANIVGEIVKGRDGLEFKPLDDKTKVSFILDEDELEDCVEGEIVVLKSLGDPNKKSNKYAIDRKLGHKDDAGMDIKIVCAEFEVYDEFPQEVLDELEDIPTEVLDSDRVGRVDLTDKVIFTIDGKDTKDIDDAISIEMSEDGQYYILGVHIADVSHYVKPGSALDQEAYKRGTSCYPPGSVIPMLPHKLSNGICSLNEGVDRCAFTCEMKINRFGEIKDSDIYKSIIRSKKKMNYDDVNATFKALEENDNNVQKVVSEKLCPDTYEPFVNDLKLLQELAHIIRQKRKDRGASDFDIPEAKVVCDMNGTPLEVIARNVGEGERLIEDDMLSANESVAKAEKFSKPLGRPSQGVYRVHEKPLPEKIEKFVSFISSLGHQVKGDIKTVTYRTMSDILNQITYKNEIEASIIKSQAVRSMPKAYYSELSLGHYGLALENYTHFTSPIRRYPDLMVHRILTDLVLNYDIDDKIYEYYANKLPEITKQCSDREVKAAEAERECVKMKMAEYMENYIKEFPNEVYDAVVKGVESFGVFVELPNLIDGMIDTKSIKGYSYDEESESLKSNNGAPLTIGSELQVKCVSASKEAKKVNFEIVKTLNKNNENQEGKKLVKEYGRNNK